MHLNNNLPPSPILIKALGYCRTTDSNQPPSAMAKREAMKVGGCPSSCASGYSSHGCASSRAQGAGRRGTAAGAEHPKHPSPQQRACFWRAGREDARVAGRLSPIAASREVAAKCTGGAVPAHSRQRRRFDGGLVRLAAPNLQTQAFRLKGSFPAPRASQTSLVCAAQHRFWIKCILIALKSGREGLFFASPEGMGEAIFATGVTPLLCAQRGQGWEAPGEAEGRTAAGLGGGTPSGGSQDGLLSEAETPTLMGFTGTKLLLSKSTSFLANHCQLVFTESQ